MTWDGISGFLTSTVVLGATLVIGDAVDLEVDEAGAGRGVGGGLGRQPSTATPP